MITAIASVIRTHYLDTLNPTGFQSAARLTRAQDAAMIRLIRSRVNRRPLARNLVATITSGEIASTLLKAIIAPSPDQWTTRYSVSSKSSERTWTVARAHNGSWGCSCPHWRFTHNTCIIMPIRIP